MPTGGLILGAAAAAPKLITGISQLVGAGKVKLQDTTTPEQRESLAIARQRAAFGQLPGATLAQARLAQVQNATLQNAALGAGSGSDLLAAGAAAARTRQNGEVQLTGQAEQYNERAQAGLGVELQRQAQQRQRDLLAYNQRKANLTQGGLENINNAVSEGASYAAYGMNKSADALANETSGYMAPGIRGTALPGYLPSLNGGRYRTSASRYGLAY